MLHEFYFWPDNLWLKYDTSCDVHQYKLSKKILRCQLHLIERMASTSSQWRVHATRWYIFLFWRREELSLATALGFSGLTLAFAGTRRRSSLGLSSDTSRALCVAPSTPSTFSAAFWFLQVVALRTALLATETELLILGLTLQFHAPFDKRNNRYSLMSSQFVLQKLLPVINQLIAEIFPGLSFCISENKIKPRKGHYNG